MQKTMFKINSHSASRNQSTLYPSQNPYGHKSGPFLLNRMANNTDVKQMMSKSSTQLREGTQEYEYINQQPYSTPFVQP
jgi:hypothetical protein